MKRGARAVGALLVLIGLLAGTVSLIRLSNGDFSGDYQVAGVFPKAGEGLNTDSEVVFRGVQIGRVSNVTLDGTHARVSMFLQPNFHIDRDATATIEPVNLFGAEEVDLTTPRGNADNGPYLAPGALFAHTRSSDELGDLFAAAAPLLSSVNDNDLATIISQLAIASQGEGPAIAQSIDQGTKLAALLNQTLNQQIAALDSFSRFSAAIADDGSSINGISAAENLAGPAFNADAAAYARLLATLTPFSNTLATLLTDYRPNIDTLLSAGDNISRLLIAQQTNVAQVIQGAYQYLYDIGHAASAQVLPDGTHFGYFDTFILFSDVNAFVCSLIAPNESGLSFLGPLQSILTGPNSPFDCSTEIAAFNKAQFNAGAPSAAQTSAAKSATAAAGSASATAVLGLLGQPSHPKSESLGAFMEQLVHAGS